MASEAMPYQKDDVHLSHASFYYTLTLMQRYEQDGNAPYFTVGLQTLISLSPDMRIHDAIGAYWAFRGTKLARKKLF